MSQAKADYLDDQCQGIDDKYIENVIYVRFFDRKKRKALFKNL